MRSLGSNQQQRFAASLSEEMQITIDVPEWMARNLEARTKKPLDANLVEMALRVYYMKLVAPALFAEPRTYRAKSLCVAMCSSTASPKAFALGDHLAERTRGFSHLAQRQLQ